MINTRQTKRLRIFECGSCPNLLDVNPKTLKNEGKVYCGWQDGNPEVDRATIDKNCPLQDWE